MTDFTNDIEQALNANTDLTQEEYAKMNAEMDESTKKHGVKGRGALTESIRHKRVQTNFYATALNILVNMYQLTAEIADRLKELSDDGNGKNE